MDKSKFYLDLSKCTEEERKSLPQIIKKANEDIYEMSEKMLNSGLLIDEDGDDCYILLSKSLKKEWIAYLKSGCDDKTELTYPEFIKLFEGGETSVENSEVERIRRSAIENLVLMEIDKKMEHLKEIEVARIEGVLTGLKICKEMWAQGTISHENIQEEIHYYQEELENLNSK